MLEGRTVVVRGDTSDHTNDNIESFLRGDNDNMESYISFQSDIRSAVSLSPANVIEIFLT